MAYSSLILTAHELALQRFSERYPEEPITSDVKQLILRAIMDFLIVGQEDPEPLAQHAVSKVGDIFAKGRTE